MRRGFTLIEILVVITIIGTLATVAVIAGGSALKKARDAKRKFEVAQVGRFISGGCYRPEAGPGTYDLAVLLPEILAKNPQYAKFITKTPRDPKRGSDMESFYRYVLTDDETVCAIYANLESQSEKVTLTSLTEPGTARGNGVLQASTAGWNGSNRYFQVSN